MSWVGLRKRILAGESVYGMMIRLSRDPGAPCVFAAAGYDFCFIDMEHGCYNMETVADLIRGAKSAGIAPLIRVPRLETFFISRVLDAGAEGVMVPMVSTREEAEKAVASCFYPPLGIRGFGPRRASLYDRLGRTYLQKAQDVLVMIQIEHIEGVNRIDEILEANGLGAIFIGPWDLSGSLGVLGEIDHPQVVASVDRVIVKAREKGIPAGIATPLSEREAQRWMERGVQFLTVGTDYGFLVQGADGMVNRLRAKHSL